MHEQLTSLKITLAIKFEKKWKKKSGSGHDAIFYEQMKITYNESIKNTTKLRETESNAKNLLQSSEHTIRMLYDKKCIDAFCATFIRSGSRCCGSIGLLLLFHYWLNMHYHDFLPCKRLYARFQRNFAQESASFHRSNEPIFHIANWKSKIYNQHIMFVQFMAWY